MRILMLSSGDRTPSSRFRMLPYVRHFQAAGHRCVVAASWPQKYDFFSWLGFRPSQQLKRAVRYAQWWQSRWRGDDVVVIDREIFDDPTTGFEERFRQTSPRLVIDLDDAVFLRYPEKFERLAAMADLIVCGNRHLQEWAAVRNANTIVIPSCVEMSRYAAKDWSGIEQRPVRLGWVGTPANLAYLGTIAGALRRLAATRSFELLVISSDAKPLELIDLTGVTLRFVVWSSQSDIEQLREIDIGLMPLAADEEWAKYKCGMKLIQYMAGGIPAVASPVGVNAVIVTDGVDGFLARSESEWESVLRSLMDNDSLRRSVGAAGRQTVSQRFSIETHFPRYEAALSQLVSQRPAASLTGLKPEP